MSDHRILSPLFIGNETGAPAGLARAGDQVITAMAGEGDGIDRLAPIHRALADAVDSAAAGTRPIAVVGDCCQTIPIMAGLERRGIAPSLVWLDSHGDFNTWETTPSKFIGGMPLAMLTGRGDQRLLQQVELAPIADRRVVLSDARDLDPGERELVQASGIAHVGLDKVAAALPAGPIYLHLDADILDARIAPAFLYPTPGGPTPQQLREVLAAILATGRVIAISICASWDAVKDRDGRTLAAVSEATRVLHG